MSLDSDRFPDGEPLPPAGQVPAPTQQAPATTDQERTFSSRFLPKHAAGEPADDEQLDDEQLDDEQLDDEPAAYEPGSAAHEPTAPRSVVSGSVVDEPDTDEPTDDEFADHEPADDKLADDEPPAAEAVPAAATASEATAYHSSMAPTWGPAAAGDAPAGIAPTADLDGPLLSDTDELHASWQRIQVAFIDDPRDAVADAAGLVDHMGQVLIAALRDRQEQLRTMWDRDGMPDGVDYADSGAAAGTVSSDEGRPTADGGPDTEQLRLLIRRYRALFNELCRS